MNDTLFWAECWVKGVFAGFMILMGIIFTKKGRSEEEMASQKYFKYGLAMFAFMTSITRIFFLVTDFHTEGTEIYNLFWKAAVASSMLALVFITIVIETYLVKTYYVFSVIGAIGVIFVILIDIPLARQLNIPLYLILGGEIFALYIYLIIKSPGNLRIRSFWMLFSLLIFSAGLLLDAESFAIPLFGVDMGLVGVILMWIGLGSYLKLNY